MLGTKENAYVEIDGSQTFILKVINEQKEFIPSDKLDDFNNIRVYGSIKNPLFSAPDVNQCLKGTTKNAERNYKYMLCDELFRDQHIVNSNKGNRVESTTLLTDYGVIHYCYLEKQGIAKIVQLFMREVIRQLKEKGVATIVDAYNQLGKVLEEERGRRQYVEKINRQNIQLQEVFQNPADAGDQEKTELIILRRETQKQFYIYVVDWSYMNSKFWKKFTSNGKKKKLTSAKKSQITLLDNIHEGINLNSSDSEKDVKEPKKNIERRRGKTPCKIHNTDEPHFKGIQESYNLFDVNLQELESNENKDYYFCIKSKEIVNKKKEYYKFIKFIDIKDTKHYKNMREILVNGNVYNNTTTYPINSYLSKLENVEYADEVITPESDVFQKTYADIIDARNTSFINTHKHLLLNEKRNQLCVT